MSKKHTQKQVKPTLSVEKVKKLNDLDIGDLADASLETMKETLGFNVGSYSGSDHIEKESLIRYWEGALLVPEITLIIGRLDGTIAGSVQLILPSKSNKISNFSCSIEHHFNAPWARGYGLSNLMLDLAEEEARKQGFDHIKLSVRETRATAIKVYEKRGYVKWGTLPKYERDKGEIVAGYFYYKDL